jgi:hypothetical protein
VIFACNWSGRDQHSDLADGVVPGLHCAPSGLLATCFWEHLIRDEQDFARHVDYIHYNPVKHGLVVNPFDWRWSSIHHSARRGIISPDRRSQDSDFGD